MTTDPFSDPEWLAYANHALEELVPKMRESAMSISLWADGLSVGRGDIKFALELGVAICMDKPIMLIVSPGTKAPDHIVRVADAIVAIDFGGDQEIVQRQIGEAMTDFQARFVPKEDS